MSTVPRSHAGSHAVARDRKKIGFLRRLCACKPIAFYCQLWGKNDQTQMIPRRLKRLIESSQMCMCTLRTYITTTYTWWEVSRMCAGEESALWAFCGCTVNVFYWEVERDNQKQQHSVSISSCDFIQPPASCVERFVALLAHKAPHSPTTLFSLWQWVPNKVASGEGFFFLYSAPGLELFVCS